MHCVDCGRWVLLGERRTGRATRERTCTRRTGGKPVERHDDRLAQRDRPGTRRLLGLRRPVRLRVPLRPAGNKSTVTSTPMCIPPGGWRFEPCV